MKDLPEFPTELDLYLNGLLDLLRTKYYNVSVNRGSKNHTFYYNDRNKKIILKSIIEHTIHYRGKTIIPNTELLTYFELKQTPPQILNLIK